MTATRNPARLGGMGLARITLLRPGRPLRPLARRMAMQHSRIGCLEQRLENGAKTGFKTGLRLWAATISGHIGFRLRVWHQKSVIT
jgi:hypothetical protein